VVLIAVIAVGAVSLAGSSSSTKSSATKKPAAAAANGVVKARLTDFKINTEAATAKAGKVTFVAGNAGAIKHEFVVLRTSKPAGALLQGSRASEAGHVAEIEDIAPGQSKRLVLNLKPGHYSLVCNLPGHYKAGMFANFTVK
jgi:uncharacterized cupredoxin-like copper-binding protein